MSADSMINSYLNQDEDEVTSVNTVDIRSINWKDNLMEKAVSWVIEDDEQTGKQAEPHEDFDTEQTEFKIRSSHTALSTADDLKSFCKTWGDAVSALNLVT